MGLRDGWRSGPGNGWRDGLDVSGPSRVSGLPTVRGLDMNNYAMTQLYPDLAFICTTRGRGFD